MSLIKILTNEKSLVEPYLTRHISFDEGLITLIVGWDLAKERGAKITNHKIDDRTYWTFLPTEKRKIFTEHLKDFKKLTFDLIKEGKITVNINPLEFNTKEELINFISKNFTEKSTYLFNDRLYIYDGNTINHLDIGLLNFMSWDIINDIKNILEFKKLDKEYKEYLKYLDIKYIPYLINAKEDIITSNIC
jgi:hypothetical protein